MSDSISESYFYTDNRDQQHKNEPYFKVPDLFVGINAKNSESDSVRSPTSPLDFRIFSSTGNPIRSPRSQNEEGQRKSWDCGKVGLSIIDSLDVETKQSGKVVRSSDSKNIDCGKLNSSLTDFESSELGSRNLVPENKVNPTPSNSKFLEGSLKSGNFLEGRLSSIPASIHSGTCIIGSIPPSEIELSEDYTCIRNHGPQSKVTHIFHDCILDCHDEKLTTFFKKSEDGGTVNSGGLASYNSMDFLKFCYSCKKSLDGEDIFMYRGEKAFCSLSCRSREIVMDEEMEKTNVSSSENNTSLK